MVSVIIVWGVLLLLSSLPSSDLKTFLSFCFFVFTAHRVHIPLAKLTVQNCRVHSQMHRGWRSIGQWRFERAGMRKGFNLKFLFFQKIFNWSKTNLSFVILCEPVDSLSMFMMNTAGCDNVLPVARV